LIDTTPSWAVDDQRVCGDDGTAMLLEALGRDDGVGEAGLVLDRDEHEALRRPRALADNDDAGDARAAAVGHARQIRGARDPRAIELGALERHRMRSGRHARAGEVSRHLLRRIHLGQRTGRGARRGGGETL
jgi:hypothetical protein